ncbi:MAG: acetate--CoA ligase family protein [Marinilabiliaceae bacterium]|jgi:acetyltransferase|nr:acetate--CoA ligase family protein [Marinilabiliaceae bacterium]
MINNFLLDPRSIVVVGGSDDISKPGGKVLYNLKNGNFRGELYVINPRAESVQGIRSFAAPSELPPADLAILAIAARFCRDTVKDLLEKCNTKAFIILSAGFSEENTEGKVLENEIVELIDKAGATLIGPNCIGVLTQAYNGVFTEPVPALDPHGVDFISGSGATAVFIMESAIPNGIRFSSVFSVGNSAQTGVEDVLEYLDKTYEPGKSSDVKLLYIESISKPGMLLKHAASLARKGCRVAAIKAGTSEAGSRAASSHTGAMANPDVAVDALFRKAGIIRCYGRQELATVASVLKHPLPVGKNVAIVTHAGGPAVMLTDALSKGGLKVPRIEGEKAAELLEKLYPGSSVANPIDFLATGNAEQMGHILDACENDFKEIDSVAVIFGSPGLFPVDEVYRVLDNKMSSMSKPVYPVLPSLITAGREVKDFIGGGRINFPDEVVFAEALNKVINRSKPDEGADYLFEADKDGIRKLIQSCNNGYLDPGSIAKLLDYAGISRVQEFVVNDEKALGKALDMLGYPVVMKVVGPIHKSDVGGVVLNVKSLDEARKEFVRLMSLKDTTGVLVQQMISGRELFAGAKREENFGHLLMAGLGGIFIEVLKDVNTGLVPVSQAEADNMLKSLRGYKLLEGIRGQEGVNIEKFKEVILKLSGLLEIAPEIYELDLNPLLGTKDAVVAVDARIRVEK